MGFRIAASLLLLAGVAGAQEQPSKDEVLDIIPVHGTQMSTAVTPQPQEGRRADCVRFALPG